MESSGWVSVRCVFRLEHDSPQAYEERMTLWRTDDLDTAIEWAEAEAFDYAKQIDAEYLGLAQAYVLSDPVQHGAEVFSLIRTSSLSPQDYVDHYFDSGGERQQTS